MKVTEIGRLQWYVKSETREEMVHLVDFEADMANDGSHDPMGPPFRCSCEAWGFNVTRPCKHILACIDFLVDSIPLTGEDRIGLQIQLLELSEVQGITQAQVERIIKETAAQLTGRTSIKSKRSYSLDRSTERKYQPR